MSAPSISKPAEDDELGLANPAPPLAFDSRGHKEHTNLVFSTDRVSSDDTEKSLAPSPSFRFHPRRWSFKMKLLAITSFLLALAAIATAIAVPLTYKARIIGKGKSATPLFVNPPKTVLIAQNHGMRIMPLGASIAYGWLSTDGNGYREDLLGLLSRGGNTDVTYVGSRHNGTMANNAVEGWPGYRIDQVWSKAKLSVPVERPNLVLLNAGTNDCAQNWNLVNTTKQSTVNKHFTASPADDIGTRMRLLVDDLFTWAPNTTVIMSTLIINLRPAINSRVDNANVQYNAVAAALQAEGKRVVIADMSATAGGPNASTMADHTHPNDVGYALMADKWYEAMTVAGAKGWL